MDKIITDKKYELIKETNPKHHGLKRIRALKDIPAYNVRAGDFGGLVSMEYNLSHEGNCWITPDAKVEIRGTVRDSALVTDNACVTGTASVGRNAFVGGKTVITHHPRNTFKIMHTPRLVTVGDKFVMMLNLTDGHLTSGCGLYLPPDAMKDIWERRPIREVIHQFKGIEVTDVFDKRNEVLRAIAFLKNEYECWMKSQLQLQT
jgi:carbonic anhydrase/acetyltransferase-like protein (isoleucine patch superfamily)